MDPETARRLIDFVEKVGLLRRDMQHRKELDPYAARITRIEQKLSALAEHLSGSHPELAQTLRTAWRLPARSLAFRNTAHQQAQKSQDEE
jgi:hypothetical protein